MKARLTLLVGALNDGFDSLVEGTAREEDATLAALADKANIDSKPDHAPVIAAARMFLAQTYDVAYLYRF